MDHDLFFIESGALLAVASAALAMEDERLEVARLRKLRTSYECEVEAPPEPEVGFSGELPCWKRWDSADFDDGRGMITERLEQEEWCQPCRDREVAHIAYGVARKRLSAATMRLARTCSRFKQLFGHSVDVER